MTQQELTCPFCGIAESAAVLRNEHALAFRDRYPLAEGHTLVIPRRHMESVFEGSPAELASVWALVEAVRSELLVTLDPQGFTIGVNDGAVAGQTVAHGHIHVIPRFFGDIADPRGGIRWVIPARAAYWSQQG